jgi:hypothetical protein
MLARVLLAAGQPAAAQREIDHAWKLYGKSENLLIRLSLAAASGTVGAASGTIGGQRERLEAAIAEAARLGIKGLEFAARLALVDVESRAGNKSRARSLAAELEKDAAARGFGLIARKAAARGQRDMAR